MWLVYEQTNWWNGDANIYIEDMNLWSSKEKAIKEMERRRDAYLADKKCKYVLEENMETEDYIAIVDRTYDDSDTTIYIHLLKMNVNDRNNVV